MSKFWVLQKKSFGLGNFVMATPALNLLSQKRGSKIDVFFAMSSIADLYRKCPFINVLNKRPSTKEFFCIGKIDRLQKESDIEALCRIFRIRNKKIPPTYVDEIKTIRLNKQVGQKTVAIFHGCLGECFKEKKDIGIKTRQYIIDRLLSKNYKVLLLGVKKDYNNYWQYNNLTGVDNRLGSHSLVDSVSLLNQSDAFISNDTGLYHVAGALKKKGLVLWKKTNFVKNRSGGNIITHFINSEGSLDKYCQAIDNFLEKIF